MRILLTIFLLSATAMAGCLQAGTDAGPGDGGDAPADPAPPPGTRFIAFGDQGTGEGDQYRVAAAMETVCLQRGCDFATALGDNIYNIGASDEYDEQFETKFEIPYANFSVPFYMVQGNHDNSADPISEQSPFGGVGLGHWYEAGDHEVAYHYRDDRSSDKWYMPARYYDQAEGNVTLLAMDTNLLMFWGLGIDMEVQDAPMPEEQEAWFDDAVATADTAWKIAIGHHPYISNGQHGNAGDYEASAYGQERPDDAVPRSDPLAGAYVERFYEEHVCGNVDLIITGHDHDLQWLEPHPDCPGTEQIVSGAGATMRTPGNEDRNPAYFQQYGTLGFLWVSVTHTTFTGVFYDVDGNVLFERTLSKTSGA